MKTAKFLTNIRLLGIALALGVSSPGAAQTEQPEDELETISIDNHYGDEASDEEIEVPDGLVYDQQNQSYRLIEDAEQDDWIEPPSEREANTDELRRLFLLYKDALENKAYLEADTLAKRIVELSIRINGLDSHESAKALTNLGIAQHNNRDFDAALRNFAASIDIIERIDDRLSAALINPLRGLGATQAAMGRADLARGSFQQAVHISHVNDGPHNKGQVDTLESMAELYISAGDFDDAMDMQESIYSIQARKIDPKSIDILPALERQAFWQHRLRLYNRERASWRRIINVIEKHHGKNALQLIPPLTSLGKSYLFIAPADYNFQPDSSVASGETYLRRANRIADNHPDSDWQTIEQTLLALGDYYILSGRPNRASNIYEETWDLLSEDEERQRNRRDHLEQLNVLQKIYPPKYYNSQREDQGQPPPDNFSTGTMSFSFTVTPTGRINQIKHLETRPPEIVDFEDTVARSLRHLVYRPRVEDRNMVRSTDIIYTHEFFYRPSDIPDPVEETNVAADQSPKTEM